MEQLYLDFNTFDSTEDQPCTVKVDSVRHAKLILNNYIGWDRVQSAEVYQIVDPLQGHFYPVADIQELKQNSWETSV